MSTSTLAEPITLAAPAAFGWQESESVSVIIPCYNEEKFIGKALANLVGQYPADYFEIVVVDGMSDDGTRAVITEFQQTHPDIALTIIDNPARTIPRGLNLGIAAARGGIIARVDAHAAPSAGYIRRCVAVLNDPRAAVVGMPCRVRPSAETSMARAIAVAVSHRFGIGDAKYRLDLAPGFAEPEEVDTVAFACFRKSLWLSLGGFNEELLTNEDYDFNYRVQQRGDRVVLDRSEHCDYFARATLSSLVRQYLRYGFWKAQMLKQQPRSLKLRHTVAPAFVLSIIFLAALGFFSPFALYGLAFLLVIHALAGFGFAFTSEKYGRSARMIALLPLVFFTIHISWGASFLVGLVHPSPRG
ncbi:MAG TPA: glycosyltransferase family 2 protein [Pyrinomonadaceae bacterium]|nr:glycosyltransferase family 2 protein [Pyrinomonadaceae bacterium]